MVITCILDAHFWIIELCSQIKLQSEFSTCIHIVGLTNIVFKCCATQDEISLTMLRERK